MVLSDVVILCHREMNGAKMTSILLPELYESEQAKPKNGKSQRYFVAVKTKYTTIDAIGKTSISLLLLGNTQVEFRFSDPKKNASITTDERGIWIFRDQ